jgi:hypothetical protein
MNPALASLFLLLAASVFTVAQSSPRNGSAAPLKLGQAGENTFVGLISDASCGPRHKLRDKTAEECTRTCQRAGQPYVLVAGEKTYRLNGNSNDVGFLAGQRAKVTGTLDGDSIKVVSVAPTK